MALDFDALETYKLLIIACSQHDIHPSSSLESEKFFRNLLTKYNGAPEAESIIAWLNEQISHCFISLGEPPKWIQSSEWQFIDDEPAIFAGQVDVSVENNEVASKYFHDDTSFYIFIGKKNPPVVIMQQY